MAANYAARVPEKPVQMVYFGRARAAGSNAVMLCKSVLQESTPSPPVNDEITAC